MDSQEVEKVIREYLPKVLHMSLATSAGDKPWVCEVHFAYDDDLNLYFRSLKSRRHSQEIEKNPHVAGNIVKQHALDETVVVGVYFEGTAELLDDTGEQKKILPEFQKRLNASTGSLEEAQEAEGHKFYKITVENWYVFGKFESSGAQKYMLKWTSR